MNDSSQLVSAQDGNDPERPQAASDDQLAIVSSARHISWEDLREHLAGPTASAITHLILVTTVLLFAVTPPEPDTNCPTICVFRQEITPIIEQPPELVQPPPDEIETPELTADDFERTSTDTTDTSTPTPGVESDAASTNAGNIAEAFDLPTNMNIKPIASATLIPIAMGHRIGDGRKIAGKFGTEGTASPVQKALHWLKEHQNPDGSWGEAPGESNLALTGWALMCFLAHGDTPQSVEFGYCVQRSIQWLAAYVEDGCKPSGREGYALAIATYAIAEAYGLT